MEIKRPFSNADWLTTHKPVRDYIELIEQKVIQLIDLNKHLKKYQKRLEKRIDELESRLNQNSQNFNKPPSADFLYRQANQGIRPKKIRKKYGQKGNKWDKQKLLETL